MILGHRSPSGRSGVSSALPLPAGPPTGREAWGADWGGLDMGTRRQCPRRSLHCPIRLIDFSEDHPGGRTIPATGQDVSDGGLYAIVSIGYGLAVGQRYLFEMAHEGLGPEPGTLRMVQQWGEILRTELLLNDRGQSDRVGIAVRLYGHRESVIPNSSRGQAIS